MKKYIIAIPFILAVMSCSKRKNYSCTCDEYFNPYVQRNFGVFTYDNAKEKDVINDCESKEVELNAIYKDSMMWNNSYHKTSKSAVKEIMCSYMPTE